MESETKISETTFSFDFRKQFDLSIPITRTEDQVNAFYIPKSSINPLQVGSFVGDVRQNGSVNCEIVSFCPHGNGTHTECIGHVTEERVSIYDVIKNQMSTFSLALVITAHPISFSSSKDEYPAPHTSEDKIIDSNLISQLFSKWKLNEKYKTLSESQKEKIQENIKSIIIRTQENDEIKKQFSGNNPPYLTPAATSFLRKMGIMNIIVDLPSIDREEDAGMLASHCAFWNFDKKKQCFIGEDAPKQLSSETRTVTELCYIPKSIGENELYILDLQVSPFVMDAAPSRPLIFPISIKQ